MPAPTKYFQCINCREIIASSKVTGHKCGPTKPDDIHLAVNAILAQKFKRLQQILANELAQ